MRKDVKHTTAPTRRRHVWQSFSSKIDQVHIDATRRIKRNDAIEDETESYFSASLHKWSELNLTIPFTEFLQAVEKKAKSLAQVVYHQEEIVRTLLTAISRQDALSLHALLDVLIQLIRDLQGDFEPHVSATIATLVPLTKLSDADVIESTFTSFAYLFKHMQKQLAIQPAPIFDAFAPMLGREGSPRHHITRLAAESLSFLLRRARAEVQRTLLQHILGDAQLVYRVEYTEGISYMIAEAVKGIDHSIHAKGLSLVKGILELAYEVDSDLASLAFDVLSNVTISLLHHTTHQSYAPILDLYSTLLHDRAYHKKNLGWQLCFISCAVRKGTRVKDWASQLALLSKSLQETSAENLWNAVRFASVLFTYAPHDALISTVPPILESLASSDVRNMLALAEILALQHPQNLLDFVLPLYRKCIVERWQSHSRSNFIQSTIMLSEHDIFSKNCSVIIDGRLQVTNAIVQACLTELEGSQPALETQAKLQAIVKFISTVHSSVSPIHAFKHMLQKCLDAREKHLASTYLAALVSTLIEALSRTRHMTIELGTRLQQHIGLWSSTSFLRAYSCFASYETSLSLSEEAVAVLMDNVSSVDHLRRLYAIQIIQKLLQDWPDIDRDLLSVCEIIESTEFTLETTRALQIQLRKISQYYGQLQTATVKLMIAKFMLGLMTTNFTPFWQFCSDTLATIAADDSTLVWSLARQWFFAVSTEDNIPVLVESVSHRQATPGKASEAHNDAFRCFNTTQCRQNCLDALFSVEHPEDCFESALHATSSQLSSSMTVSRRSQAIRIFSAIPEIAEQHSKELVPVFLAQFSTEDEDVENMSDASLEPDLDESSSENPQIVQVSPEHSSRTRTPRFNRKERNDLLVLLTKFRNPAAMSDALAVRQVVMSLLGSRDSRTQSLAFEILLHYRDPHLRRYEDNFKNLLSDNRSRDEITTFLETDAGDSKIEDQDRQYVMPVIARILYGKMINRRHASSQKKGLSNSRNIILGAIASLPEKDLFPFMGVFLESFGGLAILSKAHSPYSLDANIDLNMLSLRKQIGFCTMIQDALTQLASKVLPFISDILDALIYCFLSATNVLETCMDSEENKIRLKIARNIRHHVLQTLDMLFKYCRTFDWKPHLAIIFAQFVNPRLDKLPQESSQSPSGLLKLLGNWASSATTSPLLVEYNDAILPKVFDCLSEKTIKDNVAVFVLEIVQNLCSQVTDPSIAFTDHVRHALLQDKIDIFLKGMSILLTRQKFESSNNTISSQFLELEINTLSRISSLVVGGSNVQVLLDLLIPLLAKPRKLVPDAVKEDILNVVRNLLPTSQDYLDNSETLWGKYNAISSLFSSASTRVSRLSLVGIMQCFALKDSSLELVSTLIEDLNSFSMRRLDTPDFDRRLAAFEKLNEGHFKHLTARGWSPLVHNMIFFIGDEEELALRTNAAYTVRRFLEILTEKRNNVSDEPFLRILETDLYPAVKKGMRHHKELIRQEWVVLLGRIVKECSFWDHVSDMVPLLVDGDEEANFFGNIMHIQPHRRMRALRRLVATAEQHELRSENIAQILLPLIEHYCFAPKEESHNLIAETVKTIGALSASMRYNQYCALLKRYIALLKSSNTTPLTVVRLIDVVVDALVGRQEVATHLVDYLQDEPDATMLAVDNEEALASTKPVTAGQPPTTMLHRTIAQPEKLHDTILNNFLPHLTRYLHSKEEETVALRIPVALTVVKLLAALPHESLSMKLPGVLTDVCHILRSRSQDARDMTRKTLGSISALLGPKYLSYILVELKTALQRGYQLHVLGFTVHSILTTLQPSEGSIDYCLEQLVNMLIDDIFGETGLEKDAEDYVAKMKEMKTTKSYDSFELLARSCTITNLAELVLPLKSLLASTSSLKVLRKVDEVFRRVTLGILSNRACDTRDCLLLCYNIYQQSINSTRDRPAVTISIEEQARRDAEKAYVVDLKSRKAYVQDYLKANAHKLIKFALETLRSVLQRCPALQTAENLGAFVPLIGDSLLSNYEDVQIASLRTLTQIIKVDLRALDTGAPVFLEQAVAYIKTSPSTKTELCQASLKFVAALLKERKNVIVKDSVLTYLLIRIKADIEEPDRQGVSFSILRSVMSRKFLVPELYDIMDDVATMMVTNQSAGPRDTARSTYFQFLLDYPQGKSRLKKQMAFLVKNLEYVHVTGRRSVMETLNLIITKFDDSLLQDFIMMLFFACTMAMINDDDNGGREMAAALLHKLLERADKEQTTSIIAALRSWAYHDQVLLQRASLQGFGILLESGKHRSEDVVFFLEKFSAVLSSATMAEFEVTSNNPGDDDEMMIDSTNWQVLYYALQTFTKVLSQDPQAYISKKYASTWSNIQRLLLYRHAWIRLTAARLIGTLFAQKQKEFSNQFKAGKDLLLQDIDLVRIARHMLIQLRSPLLSADLGTQITKNLIFMLRYFDESKIILPAKEDDDGLQEEQEQVSQTCVEWLLHRAATLLQSDRDVKRETHTLVRKLLLQFFAAAIKLLSSETLVLHGNGIARPLYKYAEMETHTSSQVELKDLATEVFELFRDKVGQTKYAEIYNAVRQAQIAMRQERKQKRTIENVRFPERGAQKKVKASLKKREKRAELAQGQRQRREKFGSRGRVGK